MDSYSPRPNISNISEFDSLLCNIYNGGVLSLVILYGMDNESMGSILLICHDARVGCSVVKATSIFAHES